MASSDEYVVDDSPSDVFHDARCTLNTTRLLAVANVANCVIIEFLVETAYSDSGKKLVSL